MEPSKILIVGHSGVEIFKMLDLGSLQKKDFLILCDDALKKGGDRKVENTAKEVVK